MQFTPRSEEELDMRTLLAPGEYSAKVVQASDERSKNKGTEQIKMLLRVEDENGNHNTVFDYLLDAMSTKLRHFCMACGLAAEYESGTLSSADCAGQEMRVRIKIEKKEGYEDKNSVVDYLAESALPAPTRPLAAASSSSESAAKRSFLIPWNRFLGEFPAEAGNRLSFWQKCVTEFFPGRNGKPITAAEWKRLELAVGKWDPINGWPKPQQSPVGDEAVFQDSDIPF